MSGNKIYYRIAGHVVSVEGSLEIMKKVEGFQVFTIDETGPDFRIRLNGNRPDILDGEEYYALEAPLMTCHYTRNGEGYGMRLHPLIGEIPLVLRYDCGENTIHICGNLTPRLLKFALWEAFGWAVLKQQTIAVHASSIIYKEKAILFLGESGTGKSTHTRLWRENIGESRLLNDDSPVVRIEDGKCYVYGSPWSGKTPCYRQEKAELAAIIRLSQAPCNRISHLNLHEAIGALYPSFSPSLSADEKLMESLHIILSEILRQIPVYHLECLPNKQAAMLVHDTLYPRMIPN